MADTSIRRRDFIRTVTGAAAATTALSYSRVLGAADRVRLGVIGCGSRGVGDMNNFLALGNVDVVALCDVYAENLDRARKTAASAKTFVDHRRLLELQDVDAVLIAVPDHWHMPIAIDALNAGKDVYVEKPLTLRIDEGPPIVKAARLNKRVCQVGMQQRSGRHYLEAKKEYFDTGRLGKVTLVRTWWHGNTYHLRRAPESLRVQPASLDWARFVGPIDWRDYDPQQFYNWRAYLDYGGGQITDLFTHWIDVVHMFMGQDVPTSAVAAGGIYHYNDGRTAPDTINVLLEYPGPFTATFEATLAPGLSGSGIEFCGTEGRLSITRSRYEFTPAGGGGSQAAPPPVVVQATGSLDRDHMQNFLDCVASRTLPNGDVLIGHRSAQASHLGNLAYLEKRRIAVDPVRGEILPD
jgi:predicted dehydrogenase